MFYKYFDLFIIGQYSGGAVITAILVGSQITHVLTIVIVGLAIGSLVLIVGSVGANNQKQIYKTIGNRIFLQYLVYLLFYYSFYQSIILYILCLHH
ncbi:MATE family efflux transporter [Eggerthia catenaformis]|uniref:MATE family efflux transporter n=1 Tax=Eggerthia catenaformis TaxID=31973 RepID=UPI003CD0D204